ncbi:unnamed protein product [Linum tenue]|uniref:Uncharacterized protein n=1 Tax=Linum tenue TaxID=586396 RepID=A0AAV0JF69_9ROSI|nr:unnamed protein product [Linum tenue]
MTMPITMTTATMTWCRRMNGWRRSWRGRRFLRFRFAKGWGGP